MTHSLDNDCIAAIATPPGKGGIGVIRISGNDLTPFLEGLLDGCPSPRSAHFTNFYDLQRNPIDQGIALYFPAPHSFTGETVLELQAHGGPVVMDMLLQRCTELGARLARPGEFSERAFVNNKIDLAQAEAIADLIDSSSKQAAQGAMKSLQGAFSKQISALVEDVIHLRMYVEAAIDFPEEEVDFLSSGKVAAALSELLSKVESILAQSEQGALLQEGMTIVLAGKPNAGKSSLLNALSGRDSAIVTSIAGTTRDTLRELIHIDGLPLHIIDTAGLRESRDEIEQEGIRRALNEIEQADRILYVIDSSQPYTLNFDEIWSNEGLFEAAKINKEKITYILNKIDLSGEVPDYEPNVVALSAKNHQGMDQLVDHLKRCMSYQGSGEGLFTARRRHIEALENTQVFLLQGQVQLLNNTAGELLADDLREAQAALSSITGEFSADDLLGEIFSGFCIGK